MNVPFALRFARAVVALALLALASCADSGAADAAATDAASSDTTDAADAADTGIWPQDPETIRVSNYNVMCSFCKNSAQPDWVQGWKERVPWLLDVHTRHDADIIAVQELQAIGKKAGDPDEFSQILPPGYATFYYRHQPGDPVDFDYPDAAIAWRAARFTLVASGWFWLSPTPDVSFSTGFAKGGQLPRLVVWTTLHDSLGKRDLTVVNTHFDNNSPSQELSAPLLLERLQPLAAKAPLLVVGDFNCRPPSAAYAKLIGGTPKLVDTFPGLDAMVVVTNVDPAPAWDEPDRIDHVFFAGTFEVLRWAIDLQRYGDKVQAPSDHPGAVVVDLRWPK